MIEFRREKKSIIFVSRKKNIKFKRCVSTIDFDILGFSNFNKFSSIFQFNMAQVSKNAFTIFFCRQLFFFSFLIHLFHHNFFLFSLSYLLVTTRSLSLTHSIPIEFINPIRLRRAGKRVIIEKRV